MKIFLRKAAILFLLPCTMVMPKNGLMAQVIDSMRIMSWNIRYDNPIDGPDRWDNRKDEVVKLIMDYQPAILGIQEGLPHQVHYLDSLLVDYHFTGIGRDPDGGGEYSAIYYDTNRLHLISGRTFWLSTTPSLPEAGWDAALPRICTMALFTTQDRKDTIYALNTHFDHIGEKARLRSAQLLIDTLRLLSNRNKNALLVLTGDFNGLPDSPEISALRQYFYKNSDPMASPDTGPEATFNAFDINAEPEKRIDYIFVKHGWIRKLTHDDRLTSAGRFPSDHFPITAIVELTANE